MKVPKKARIFDALMEGFREAIARKKGRPVTLRVTAQGRNTANHGYRRSRSGSKSR